MRRVSLWLSLALGFAGAAFVSAAVAAPSGKYGPQVAALVAAAAKEGRLQLSWSGTGFGENGQAVPGWVAAFNRFYGLNLNSTFTPAPSMPQQAVAVLQALRSGTPAPTDVIILGSNNLASVVQGHATRAYDWTALAKEIGVDLPPAAVATDNAAIAFTTEVSGITYDKEAVPAKDVPQTLEDVLKPEWKGRIASTPYAAGFDFIATFDPQWGPDKTNAFVTRLSQQIGGLIRCSEPGPLLSGQFDMLVLECDIATAIVDARRGVPIGYVVPKDVSASALSFLAYMAMPKTSPDPAAGALFALFMVTKEGQAASWNSDGSDLTLLPGSRMAAALGGAPPKVVTVQDYMRDPDTLKYARDYVKILAGSGRK